MTSLRPVRCAVSTTRSRILHRIGQGLFHEDMRARFHGPDGISVRACRTKC